MAEPAYEPVQPVPATLASQAGTVATRRRSGLGSLAVRILLTLVGAAGLIIGGFLNWIHSLEGVNLNVRALWQTTFNNSGSFVATVGFVSIVLGLVAIIGLSPRSGWLTRFAGALGIVAFVLFVIEVYRANLDVGNVQIGAWIALAGSVIAIIGGFFGTRTVIVETAGPVAVAP
jgi:hypothetical protein